MERNSFVYSTVRAPYPIGGRDQRINVEPARMFETARVDGMMLAHAANLPHIKIIFPISQYGSETDDSVHIMAAPERVTKEGGFVNFEDLDSQELAYFGQTAEMAARMGLISGYNYSAADTGLMRTHSDGSGGLRQEARKCSQTWKQFHLHLYKPPSSLCVETKPTLSAIDGDIREFNPLLLAAGTREQLSAMGFSTLSLQQACALGIYNYSGGVFRIPSGVQVADVMKHIHERYEGLFKAAHSQDSIAQGGEVFDYNGHRATAQYVHKARSRFRTETTVTEAAYLAFTSPTYSLSFRGIGKDVYGVFNPRILSRAGIPEPHGIILQRYEDPHADFSRRLERARNFLQQYHETLQIELLKSE